MMKEQRQKRKESMIFHAFSLSFTFLFFCLLGVNCFAQHNLVPNPSFEPIEKKKPSTGITQEGKLHQQVVDGWYTPNSGTTDFYNSDRSTFLRGLPTKKARTGQGRIGMFVNESFSYSGEYIQARLNKPLEKGKHYCVTIHYSLDKRCVFYSESIGVVLTRDPITADGTVSLYNLGLIRSGVEPLQYGNAQQNKNVLGWQEGRQVYIADGGEEYITIGGFTNYVALPTTDADPIHNPQLLYGIFGRLAYYYFDDISVVEIANDSLCHSPQTTRETIPALNHFVFLVDVSESMAKAGYLDQLKSTLISFTDTLGPNDLVSIMAFDIRTHTLLREVSAAQKSRINEAVDHLRAGSVTNVDKAITRAYQLMDSTHLQEGNNRIVLVSDAVFELSKESRGIIRTHYKNHGICFSMVQFGDQRNKTLEKLTAFTHGTYTHSKNEDVLQALSGQIKKPGEDDYTRPRHPFVIHRERLRDDILR